MVVANGCVVPQQFVLNAVSLAMARDGSSGGGVRMIKVSRATDLLSTHAFIIICGGTGRGEHQWWL